MKIKNFFVTPRIIFPVFVSLILVVVSGCGGGSFTPPAEDAAESLVPQKDLGELTETEQLFYSESYAGYIVVFLDGARPSTRVDTGKSTYAGDSDATLTYIQDFLTSYPDASLKPSVETDPEQLDARREELEILSGKQLTDFNKIKHIHIEDPDRGVEIIRALEEMPGIHLVYPKLRAYGTTLVNTPSLVQHQGYLYPESTHGGLNAMAAWNAGITGQGISIGHGDSGWNFDHEDLPLGSISPVGCLYTNPSEQDCDMKTSHGTTMAGIMVGIENGHGVTGIAPDSTLYPDRVTFSIDTLISMVDGAGFDLEPGSVYAVIVGRPGPNCAVDHCLPMETDPDDFDAIEIAVEAGVTVISSAANGGKDFDNPATYHSWMEDLSQKDSGSIIVGASNGAAKQKIPSSNYGSPIDVFAWGEGVASTAYPISTEPTWTWNGTTPPLPPSPMDVNAYFVDVVAGTSPATAQIAAAAALVQSYAKSVMVDGDTRFIRPHKMREILVQSGVAQSGGGGNIGVQPRIDVAMNLVDNAWSAWSSTYPKLISGQPLTLIESEALETSGLGLVCKHNDPNSDPCCPDDDMWQPGTGIGNALDFDGDGRADLVSWKRGQFKIDLSSVGSAADGFGSWDTSINYPIVQSDLVWPYVEDMDSDGRSDLVLYDKSNGTWYIAYINSAMLSGGGFGGWDEVITTNVHDQLQMDPEQTQYCRPHPGDYDGNGWVDLAVACSDGVWYVKHSSGTWPSSITYDQQVTYLTSQQLDPDNGGAPGWAYLTSVGNMVGSLNMVYLMTKVPDGIVNSGKVFGLVPPQYTSDYFDGVTTNFGGNSSVMLAANYSNEGMASLGVKGGYDWSIADPYDFDPLTSPSPSGVYGNISCHPIAADFDGDGFDDRAVMCPDGWKIDYSSSVYDSLRSGEGVRSVGHEYTANTFTLPGRSYSGNVSYDLVQELIAIFQDFDPGSPPPIPVDMVMIQTCQLTGSAECQ